MTTERQVEAVRQAIAVAVDCGAISDTSGGCYAVSDFGKPCECLQATHAALAAAEAAAWDPIESAPRDGTRVLVFDGHVTNAAHWEPSRARDAKPGEGWWQMLVWYSNDLQEPRVTYEYEVDFINLQPTHWRPLPYPPGQEARYDD